MGSNLVLVPEPVAAAAHFASFPGQGLVPGQALAVYDLGAGTFDVAVVGATQSGFAVLAEAGLPDLGGLDVDQALLEHVGRQVSARDPGRWQRLLRPEGTNDRRAQRALREDVRSGKEALSRHPQTEVPLPEPFGDVLVTRVELEALIRPSLLRSVELLAGTIRSTGLTPERLAGIYLVGGSSRIPLIATLIAEGLRVVPTSLDQPETAVALGAHHVPREGVSMRTTDISGAVGPSAPNTGAMNSGAVPMQNAGLSQQVPQQGMSGPIPVGHQGPPSTPFPQSGPQPIGPQSGPMSNPIPQQMVSGPPPQFPSTTPSQGSSSKKPWLIVGAVAVVVLALVGVLLVVNSNSDNGGGTAQTGGNSGTNGSGTHGNTGGGGTSGLADCSDTSQDDKGFTQCMAAFAGSHADDPECKKGMFLNGQDMTSTMEAANAQASTCDLSDKHSLIYLQFPSPAMADQMVEGFKQGANQQNLQPVDWSGGDYSGQYWSIDFAGVGALLYTVKDKPLAGFVMNLDSSNTSSSTSLADYFEQNVKPGS
ncbi:Hsp70 protein [Labedaea rhizosphaerae]|uniref:Hsp70 protein n=2 Tax=Labedaea rhizosphaerae TaxID=598644 RepID=A0A4R6S8E8_LABRH|nr:Hsp70 protein [Labedaea rhizosphaerae]